MVLRTTTLSAASFRLAFRKRGLKVCFFSRMPVSPIYNQKKERLRETVYKPIACLSTQTNILKTLVYRTNNFETRYLKLEVRRGEEKESTSSGGGVSKQTFMRETFFFLPPSTFLLFLHARKQLS